MSSKNFNEVSCIDILKSFFLLGLTSFGGPIAHIGFFRNTFVKEKKWLDDDTYMEFVSLCNFLPGPSWPDVRTPTDQFQVDGRDWKAFS